METKKPIDKLHKYPSFKIVLIYAIVSSVYIWTSDYFLELFTTDALLLTKLQTFKGLGFILITSGLLYILVKTNINTIKSYYERLIDLQAEVDEQLVIKVKERTLELANSLEREKELNGMKSNFVSFASHEFRTPLTTILSSCSIIEMYKNTEEQEKRLKHLNRIAASVKSLTDILNDFLAAGELERGFMNIEFRTINLAEFAAAIVEEIDGMLKEKNQQIICNHKNDAIIDSSEKLLKNILFNLLSNAIKYSPPKTQIYFSSQVVNNKVVISIKDQGIGIPKEDQKKLFDQFFRAGNVGNIQGTGLGLNIVKKYIELIKGDIKFISKEGEGTTFIIELPKVTNHENNFGH